MDKGQKVRVAVRLRPPLAHEEGDTFERVHADPENSRVVVRRDPTGPGTVFPFDVVLDENSTQVDVFERTGAKALVEAVVDGYDAVIFAYGQTGSGKTHTMDGFSYEASRAPRGADAGARAEIRASAPRPDSVAERVGIIPRAIKHLFTALARVPPEAAGDTTVRCSFLQVYSEQIYDLLSPAIDAAAGSSRRRGGVPRVGLKMRYGHGGFFVENLFQRTVSSPAEALRALQEGVRRRVMASHALNAASSRSHCVFSLTVSTRSGAGQAQLSRLSLVDLAGSERVSRTGARGVTFREGVAINKSLFTLRKVVTALADGAAAAHVPFRDSKLTALLQRPLSGAGLALMIACLAPGDSFVDENLGTLAYAGKASRIALAPERGSTGEAAAVRDLRSRVSLLKRELARAQALAQALAEAAAGGSATGDGAGAVLTCPSCAGVVARGAADVVRLLSGERAGPAAGTAAGRPATAEAAGGGTSAFSSPAEAPAAATAAVVPQLRLADRRSSPARASARSDAAASTRRAPRSGAEARAAVGGGRTGGAAAPVSARIPPGQVSLKRSLLQSVGLVKRVFRVEQELRARMEAAEEEAGSLRATAAAAQRENLALREQAHVLEALLFSAPGAGTTAEGDAASEGGDLPDDIAAALEGAEEAAGGRGGAGSLTSEQRQALRRRAAEQLVQVRAENAELRDEVATLRAFVRGEIHAPAPHAPTRDVPAPVDGPRARGRRKRGATVSPLRRESGTLSVRDLRHLLRPGHGATPTAERRRPVAVEAAAGGGGMRPRPPARASQRGRRASAREHAVLERAVRDRSEAAEGETVFSISRPASSGPAVPGAGRGGTPQAGTRRPPSRAVREALAEAGALWEPVRVSRVTSAGRVLSPATAASTPTPGRLQSTYAFLEATQGRDAPEVGPDDVEDVMERLNDLLQARASLRET